MTEETSKQDSFNDNLDLSGLTDFQFGPSWARKKEGGDKPRRPDFSSSRSREDRGNGRFKREGGSAERAGGRDGERRQGQGFRGERRDRTTGRDDRRDGGREGNRSRQGGRAQGKGGRFERPRQPREELAEPTLGLRVELRPVDVLLSVWAAEVTKHKRVVSLFEFAKVVMGGRDRYDLVFMKQEEGPQLIQSKKEDRSCWISREEALRFMWGAPWFNEFYKSEEEAVEAPKGEFQGIAKCRLSGDLVGPANWHGYQAAVMALHRDKFSHMPVDEFRRTIEIVKDEEVVQKWLAEASRRIVWKPLREGAEDVVLADRSAVEKDFDENHFDAAFLVCDKVFVNGSTDKKNLSPGLWSHLVKLAEITRRHPSMLIPNLCHGLARHHMPIFKWDGGHHTGPSRPRTIPAGTVLADNMTAILNWVRENSGKGVDIMLNELGGMLPKVTEEAPVAPAKSAEPSEPVEQETPTPVEEISSPVEENAEVPAVVEEAPTSEVVAEAPVPEVEAVAEAAVPAEVSEVETIRLRRQELVRDIFWLCEQGYVLVFADRTIRLPKVSA